MLIQEVLIEMTLDLFPEPLTSQRVTSLRRLSLCQMGELSSCIFNSVIKANRPVLRFVENNYSESNFLLSTAVNQVYRSS